MTCADLLPCRAEDELPRAASAGRVAGGLRWLLLFMATAYILTYIVLACLRMGYPYELEWIEGCMVDHIRWILSGRGIYVEPTLEFVPNYYTPLYLYLGAGLSKVMGVGFLPLRLISFVSSLGCFWVIGRFVRRETGTWTWAVLSAGLFAACYRATGAWFDIARIDSLFLLLALASVYLVRFHRDGRWLMLAGLLMGLSFLTKQSALVIAAPLAVWTLLANRGWGRWAFPATFAALVLGTTWLFDAATAGRYSHYVFGLPNRHPYVKIVWLTFWWQDIGKNLPVAMTVMILAAALARRIWPGRDIAFFAALLAGMIGTSWLSRLHEGGYENVLMPAAAVLAIGFAVAASGLLSGFDKAAAGGAVPAGYVLPVRRALLAGLYLAGVWQFVLLGYLPNQQVPTHRDRRAGDAMIRRLAGLPGDVLMLDHGFLHTFTGVNTFHAQAGALWAMVQGTDGRLTDELVDAFRQAVRTRRYDVLVLEEMREGKPEGVTEFARKHHLQLGPLSGPSFLELFRRDIDENYRCLGPMFDRDDVFWPVTGFACRPGLVYVRRDKVSSEMGAGDHQGSRGKASVSDVF